MSILFGFIKTKEHERNNIKDQMDEFIRNGGKIKKFSNGDTSITDNTFRETLESDFKQAMCKNKENNL